jgi:hypothetical protein
MRPLGHNSFVLLSHVMHLFYYESPSFDRFYTIHILIICVTMVSLSNVLTKIRSPRLLVKEISASVLRMEGAVIKSCPKDRL